MSTILSEQEEKVESEVPVCGGNLESLVTDTSKFIDEIHYRVGGRLYIENAD
jgi:hypothetical protein